VVRIRAPGRVGPGPLGTTTSRPYSTKQFPFTERVDVKHSLHGSTMRLTTEVLEQAEVAAEQDD